MKKENKSAWKEMQNSYLTDLFEIWKCTWKGSTAGVREGFSLCYYTQQDWNAEQKKINIYGKSLWLQSVCLFQVEETSWFVYM